MQLGGKKVLPAEGGGSQIASKRQPHSAAKISAAPPQGRVMLLHQEEPQDAEVGSKKEEAQNVEVGSKKEAPQNTEVGSKKEAPQNTEVGSKKEGPSAGGFDLHTSAKDKCTPRELECTSAGSTRHGTGYDLLTLDEDWTQTAWLARTSVVPIRKGGGHWMKRFLLSC